MNIKVEELCKSYMLDRQREVKVLKGLNFEVKPGETVAVVGPSGAGKSTLLHMVGLMDRPTSGKIRFDTNDMCLMSENERSAVRRNKIGFLFQMHYLLPDFTVWENVLFPVWDDRRKKEAEARILLEQLGLADRLEHMPAELSGGEQQRVAMARALVNEPKFLMADEPTGNLDRETGVKVEDLLFSECERRHITLLLVTHNPELAERADRIFTMRDGLITEQKYTKNSIV